MIKILLFLLVITTSQVLGLVGKPGGFIKIDSQRPDVQAAASYAIKILNERSNSIYKLQMVNVISAECQVVKGINYRLLLDYNFVNKTTGLTVEKNKAILVNVYQSLEDIQRGEFTSLQIINS